MTLRDAVRSASNSVSQPARDFSRISANLSLPLAERLAAFRQLIDYEVGGTWVRRSRALERDFDRRGIYLKFEGDNPTGTQKDRIAFAQVADALAKGHRTIELATCGNYGVAVALAARLAGLHCAIAVPAGYHTHRLTEMEQLGATISRPPGSYEAAVAWSSARAVTEGHYDANPGEANAELQLTAYSYIADELLADLPRPPERVAVPVSNGTLLAGIHRGFVRLQQAGQLATLPRMTAASSTRQNPIVASFRQGLTECRDLDPDRIHETTINEPLINWHSFDGQFALDAVHQSHGDAANVSDEKMRKAAAYLREKEALQVLPASTAGLVALIESEAPRSEQPLHVAVLTAKR